MILDATFGTCILFLYDLIVPLKLLNLTQYIIFQELLIRTADRLNSWF